MKLDKFGEVMISEGGWNLWLGKRVARSRRVGNFFWLNAM